MSTIKKSLSTEDKLTLLSADSRFDLACACASRPDEHRTRSREGKWIYPVSLPQGGRTYIFKTLLSNVCTNDCLYCPLREDANVERVSLSPVEVANAFLSYVRKKRVSGLFLSSGVISSPDLTMSRINEAARLLRRAQFKGYIHLKIIPGASEAAIRESLSLASAVSLNIEAPQEENFKRLSHKKNYERDILQPIQLISRLTAPGSAFSRIKHTTQFVVGAGGETDRAIIERAGSLYSELGLNRIYFSAYQRPNAEESRAEHAIIADNHAALTREHRLYQVDWLIRKYGFRPDEIPLEESGNLSLEIDPKEMWARVHPEFFPVNINKAPKSDLLRIPGLGDVTIERILALRAEKRRLKALHDLGKMTKLLLKASAYVSF
jgi:predicted DNA-binding helix-hairpin-helix protein